ncbi:class 1 fructose-bisphosphatase [Devosia naphthalenivorans]|uniref:class 1 fructose-bisphosphatase n=1 Tax=Devosia naphthalenivorans TaxID=2082392 RepID=UPI0013B051B7|nr:class 1 fructose-bisphosphatase [Devosia naphthalenivorans]
MNPNEDVMLTLEDFLDTLASRPAGDDVKASMLALADASKTLHGAIRSGSIPGAAQVSSANASGEMQKPLDVFADETFLAAAKAAPIAIYGSEEQEQPIMTGAGSLAIAIDPLDGSSNIETNIAVGTIFSILATGGTEDAGAVFTQPATAQLAAGFFMYGAQLLLVFSAGTGTHTFAHNPDTGGFEHVARCEIPPQSREYALNSSNRRHWHQPMQDYVADLERGAEGPRRQDFGMRYVGSLVADCYRILQRGGVFIYPSDRRKGYESGRLRQLYEANPIGLCIEQAGGAATDTKTRLLDLPSTTLHAKVPLAFGSRDEIAVLQSYANGGAKVLQ